MEVHDWFAGIGPGGEIEQIEPTEREAAFSGFGKDGEAEYKLRVVPVVVVIGDAVEAVSKAVVEALIGKKMAR